jgi:hypothetical protein
LHHCHNKTGSLLQNSGQYSNLGRRIDLDNIGNQDFER